MYVQQGKTFMKFGEWSVCVYDLYGEEIQVTKEPKSFSVEECIHKFETSLVQLRSGDEGETTIYKCTLCNVIKMQN